MTDKIYPECEKITEADKSGKSPLLTDFLDWLDSKGIILAKYGARDDLYPIHTNKEQLLADFFGIDLALVEKERRQILEDLRNQPNENSRRDKDG